MSPQLITPPFVECPDGHRCAQTIILMILRHFRPERVWDWDEADKICYYQDGLHTWNTAPIKAMIEHGFEAVYYESMDPKKFISDPVATLSECRHQKTVDYMLAFDDIPRAIQIETALLDMPHYRHVARDWQWPDVEKLLAEGYLILVWVNPRKFYHRHDGDEAISGHFVLLFGYRATARAVMLHDGGGIGEILGEGFFQMNTLKSYRTGSDDFMRAAKSDKGDGGDFLVAFRLRGENIMNGKQKFE